MITDRNYLSIQGFMIRDLHLKGNELLVYALLYGFCQDGENKFNGSLSYIAEWISASKQTVINTLKSLEEKNLIIKHQDIQNNITFNKYEVVKNFDHHSKTEESSQKSLMGVVKKFDLINNINNNIKENNIKEKFSPPTLEEVIEYFKSRNLTESSAKRFFDYYTAGCWKDGKGDKIKNWKQKAIAVWDKPENREKTPEDIKLLEKREEESIIQNYWLKNCSLLNSKRRPNLILVNISNMLDKLKDKDDYAHKVVQTMVKQILTEEQIEKVLNYIESRI